MASGFIILQDGRCFAKRWWCYDAVLREIIIELTHDQQGQELAFWLNSLLPTADAWHRRSVSDHCRAQRLFPRGGPHESIR